MRLAPSPTGNLHIGTARTALFNWLYARNKGGKFLLRIEDTDKDRSKETFKENILEGLKWLGLDFDEPAQLQSERVDTHQAAIQNLLDKGFAYRCYATEEELEEMRKQQKSNNQAPRYDNRHRDLTDKQQKDFQEEGRSSVVRFRIEENQLISWNDMVRGPMSWKGYDLGGDMVIARRAPAHLIGDPLYNLVVVVDDSEMGITQVIRGEDHLANTAKQLALYKALNLHIPEFAHTPLILNAEGRKLSKRDGVTSITDFKKMGYTADALINYMALLGWSVPEGMDERFTKKDASKVFGFDRVNKAGAKFDWDKLNWLNAQVIHDWSAETLLENLTPLFNASNWQVPNKDWGLELAELIKPSLTLLTDAIDQSRVFFEEPQIQEDGKNQLQSEGAREALTALADQLTSTPWNGMNLNEGKELLDIVCKATGVKKGVLMKSLRAALLGQLKGPDLITTWSLLARTGCDRSRLGNCLR